MAARRWQPPSRQSPQGALLHYSANWAARATPRMLMDPQWDDSLPIYRQLRDRIVAMILEEALREGDPLPSVRSVAAEFRLNPLTVLKGYQRLVDEKLVEKRRGLGMFVSTRARKARMKGEREWFLTEVWPKGFASMHRLGRPPEDLAQKGSPPRSERWPSTGP